MVAKDVAEVPPGDGGQGKAVDEGGEEGPQSSFKVDFLRLSGFFRAARKATKE